MSIVTSRWRPVLVAAAVVVVAIGLGGCGSSSKSPAGASSSSATGGGSSAGSSAAASALAFVKQHEQRPTQIALTAPVGKPIPTGKVVYYITCGVGSCTDAIPLDQQAAKVLGWKLVVLNTDGSPQQVANAWAQALRAKPDGILTTALPLAQIGTYVKQAAAAGIAVANYGGTEPIAGTGLVGNETGPASLASTALAEANWVFADASTSGDSTPASVFVNLPDYPSVTLYETHFKADMAKLCSSCAVGTIEIGLANIQNAASLTVSYLRAHPSTKYVILGTDSAFSGIAAAITAAGLTGVKVFGSAPKAADLSQIQSGLRAGTIVLDDVQQTFLHMDILVRYFAGVPQVNVDAQLPTWIVTKSNIGDAVTTGPSTVVLDVPAQFAKLWGKV